MTDERKKLLIELLSKEQPKWERFLTEYLQNGYNATEAAMKTFNCSSRASAQALGSRYLKQIKPLARMVLEDMGVTYTNLIKFAIHQFEESDNPVPWFDRLMRIYLGYDPFNNKSSSV